jgi:hypothetical protein
MKKNITQKEINIAGVRTTPSELLKEFLINFSWGFTGNSMVVFISREIDLAVFVNFVVYYILISYIVNREKYKTRFGKFIVQPVSAAMGAFVGYKLAQIVSLFL